MKVLHVGEYVQGGVATYISLLLNHPNHPEIKDYLICADKNSQSTWDISDERIYYYHYYRSITQIPFAIYSIYKAIRDIQPDVVYCHSTWAGLFVRLPLFFLKKNFRIIYNAHGWSFLRDTSKWKRMVYACVERVLQKKADIIINVSKYEYESAIAYGLEKNNQVVIYSGLSGEKGIIDSKIMLPKGKINILYVGRFDSQKGLDILLEAFKICNREDLHLTIIGDNVVGDGAKIEKINSEKITFMGWVPHEKLASYYNACDVVVMPSRWEAFGLVAIEAMKYGKALIVSNKGALPELVQEDVNGMIIDIDDKKSFKKTLERLRKDRLEYMGKKGLDMFHKMFLKEHMLEKTINLEKGNKSGAYKDLF